MTVPYHVKQNRRRAFVRSGRRIEPRLWLVSSRDLHIRITVRGMQERRGVDLELRRESLVKFAKEQAR